jgi:hypothetical protein
MKKLQILILGMLMITLTSFGQTESVKNTYPKCYSLIVSNAKLKWDADFEMQVYTIKKQCNALNEYLEIDHNSVSKEDWNAINFNALEKWSEHPDFTSALKLAGSETEPTKKLDIVWSYLNIDWEMVVYTIKKQIEAYNMLK